MGVAGKSLANKVTRRQTLTGIKTSANPSNETKRLSNVHKRLEEPIYDNIEQVPVPQAKKIEPKQRRSKRIEGRRFLTIGYDGEVRTPLKEKKNTLVDRNNAKVQRSKSAQTPSNPKKVKKKQLDDKENEIVFCQTVQRSLSLRSPRPQIGKSFTEQGTS